MKPQHHTVHAQDLPKDGFVFAPGVIEGPSRRRWLTDRRVEQLARVALTLALLATLATLMCLPALVRMLGSLL